jgi:hypothetical protein
MDEAVVARHILPSLSRFDCIIQVHGVVGFKAACGREGRDLNLNSFIVILTVALPLLVLMTFLICARWARRVRNCKRTLCAILLPDGARLLLITYCGVLMRLGMPASGVEGRRGF